MANLPVSKIGVSPFESESAHQYHGQVAQLVERKPEELSVGGSIPSLSTIFLSSIFCGVNHHGDEQKTARIPPL